jgi:hypothetical protein
VAGVSPEPKGQEMTERDPRIDPRPGDIFRGGGVVRRVLKREGARVLVSSGLTHYWMRLDSSQKWCQERGAVTCSGEVKKGRDDGVRRASRPVQVCYLLGFVTTSDSQIRAAVRRKVSQKSAGRRVHPVCAVALSELNWVSGYPL